ncbi:MAG: adenylate/guanylate cyclase domain-containing protein [Syntrophaceae bacterium]|nr:adenylate/guanylate cyclase domain-containing protein [Syntrophaceae bacterium]
MSLLPDHLPHYSVGPFFGFATNGILAVLCLAILSLYHHYRPLRSLFLFYLFSTFLFLGWVIYGIQKSPESILLGYRIDLAALALLPASWTWFDSALSNKRMGRFSKAVSVIGFALAACALWGSGSWFLGIPLVPHEIESSILRPQSKLLRPFIHFFCLGICFFYFVLTLVRLKRLKSEKLNHLIPFGIGMLFWFLGGAHDAIRSAGILVPIKGQILWITSLWLSVFLSVAVALHFRSLNQAIREARDVFERFVPPAYLRRIAAKGLKSIRLGEADQQKVTILCCDIRGFTSLSERTTPSELIALLNHLFERITRVVDWRRGVIDKFLGDAILCIFEGPDSSQRAVNCGVDILTVVKSINRDENRSGDHDLRIGIGLHTGPVILGTIGSPNRMDSTVLGLTVNLAKRLEEVTRPLGVDMLISDQVADQLPSGHGHRFRKLGEVYVKGSSTPIGILEVYDQDPPEVRHLKDQIEPILSDGISLYRSGSLHAALSKFQEAQHIYSDDLPLRLLIHSVNQSIKEGQVVKGMALLDFRLK